MGQECVTDPAVFAPLLRAGRPEVRTLVTAVAHLYVQGAPVDWQAVFAGRAARRIDLPDLRLPARPLLARVPSAGAGDVTIGGPRRHRPPAARCGGRAAGLRWLLFTGRLSLSTHPWLADHAVMGRCCCPAQPSSSWRCARATQRGCDLLEELTLAAPLILPELGGVQLR